MLLISSRSSVFVMSIWRGIETLQNSIELEADIAASKIDLLERSNVAVTYRYQALGEQLQPVAEQAQKLIEAKKQLEDVDKSLEKAEEYVEYLEKVLSELNQWVDELDVKSRRLTSR